MSLFVAIHPSEAAACHLQSAIGRVRGDPQSPALQWIPSARWHVTLAFLGEVDEDRTTAACIRLDGVGRVVAPIEELHLAGSGTFGRRVLWIAVRAANGNQSPRLSALARLVAAAMRRERIAVERTTWQPHLTVARARQGDPSMAAASLADYEGPAWPVDRLDLIRSTGGPNPTHDVLHSTALTGAT